MGWLDTCGKLPGIFAVLVLSLLHLHTTQSSPTAPTHNPVKPLTCLHSTYVKDLTNVQPYYQAVSGDAKTRVSCELTLTPSTAYFLWADAGDIASLWQVKLSSANIPGSMVASFPGLPWLQLLIFACCKQSKAGTEEGLGTWLPWSSMTLAIVPDKS